MTPEDPYLAAIGAWRRRKDADLRARDSWLALAGLYWLGPGRAVVGSAPDSDLRLPSHAPARLGTFESREGRVTFEPSEGAAAIDGAPMAGEPLRPDTSGDPHRLRCGEISLMLIERGGRRGIRVWDNARPERARFPGRAWYPIDPAARRTARFETAAAGRTIAVPNQLGSIEDQPLLGTAVFDWRDTKLSLDAVPTSDGGLWFLFADQTNGMETYPAGRFLVGEAAEGGGIVLDFNRAYNPPCAFTEFATCPLPPKGNHLPVPIRAGERIPPSHTPAGVPPDAGP